MAIITVRIDDELRKKMRELKHVNWSEVIRQAIIQKIQEEERFRKIDRRRLLKAVEITDSLKRKIEGWNSTLEIRKWRDLRG